MVKYIQSLIQVLTSLLPLITCIVWLILLYTLFVVDAIISTLSCDKYSY